MNNHNTAPQPSSQPEATPDIDWQSYIDEDGGLYDQALKDDAKYTKRAQRDAYDSYKENIQFTHRRERKEAWDDMRNDMRESFETAGRVTKQVARKIGRAALSEVMPLATEFIQRRNVNKSRRAAYQARNTRKSVDERYEQQKSAFTGSVEDFKRIRQESQTKHQADYNKKLQKRAEANGYGSWDEYIDNRDERAERRRRNVRKVIKKSLPLWLSSR